MHTHIYVGIRIYICGTEIGTYMICVFVHMCVYLQKCDFTSSFLQMCQEHREEGTPSLLNIGEIRYLDAREGSCTFISHRNKNKLKMNKRLKNKNVTLWRYQENITITFYHCDPGNSFLSKMLQRVLFWMSLGVTVRLFRETPARRTGVGPGSNFL